MVRAIQSLDPTLRLKCVADSIIHTPLKIREEGGDCQLRLTRNGGQCPPYKCTKSRLGYY